MNIQIDVAWLLNIKNLKLDLHRELNSAGEVVKADHFQRLEMGMGINGPMEPLADSTIEAKGFNQILVATHDRESMRNLIQEDATTQKQFTLLYPGKDKLYNGVTKQQIGAFHQEGGRNLPKREWFGVTKKAEARCIKIVADKINKILDRA